MRIPSPDSNEVIAVRFTQTREHIEVGIKTSQPEVAQSLRNDLPDLVDGLHREGFRTEITPRQPAQETSDQRHNRHRDVDDWTDHRQRRQRPQPQEEKHDQ